MATTRTPDSKRACLPETSRRWRSIVGLLVALAGCNDVDAPDIPPPTMISHDAGVRPRDGSVDASNDGG